jgi:hypothetical protein
MLNIQARRKGPDFDLFVKADHEFAFENLRAASGPIIASNLCSLSADIVIHNSKEGSDQTTILAPHYISQPVSRKDVPLTHFKHADHMMDDSVKF